MKNKKMLFLCSGNPYYYPEDKKQDFEFRKKWNNGFGSQLLHPTFMRSYALYLGQRNHCFKICPGVIGVVRRACHFGTFSRTASVINFVTLIIGAYKLQTMIDFSTIETFLPGDRLLEGIIIKKLTKVPLIAQVQGDFDLSYFDEDLSKENFKKLMTRQFQKFIYAIFFKNADLVLGYSDHCASFAICNGAAPQKVRRCRIHSFIEDFENHPILPKTEIKHFPLNNPVAFLWCRLAPEKKLSYALEAIKLAMSENKDLICLIAGDGPLKAESKSKVTPFEDRIIFLGQLDRIELKNYIAHSNICLVPMGGHSLIEAALCKKPVIAFNWEWHAEMIIDSHSGYLIDYPKVDDFCQAILSLLKFPEKGSEMGHTLYKRARTLFKKETVLARELLIWNEFHHKRDILLQGKLS